MSPNPLRAAAGLLLAALALLAGCTVQHHTEQAKALAESFYRALHDDDLEAAAARLAGKKPQEAWLDELRARKLRLGRLQRYRLKKIEYNTVFSGTYYVMTFETAYSRGTATETLTLFEPVNQAGHLQAVALQVEARPIEAPIH